MYVDVNKQKNQILLLFHCKLSEHLINLQSQIHNYHIKLAKVFDLLIYLLFS